MPKRTLEIAGRTITLDARPDRLDIRDLPYRPAVVSLDPIYPNDHDVAALLSNYIASGLILDQKSQGACTGFGLAAVINYLLWRRSHFKLKGKDRASPRMLFHLAKFYDEWPGEEYQGSSCRGALKGWHRHGVCRDALWPFKNHQFVRPLDGWDTEALPNADGESCNQCHGCKLTATGNHPDLIFIVPEEPGKAIGINQIRELILDTQLKPQYDAYRVVIIDPADQLNKAAANAFLKCLEEPTERTLNFDDGQTRKIADHDRQPLPASGNQSTGPQHGDRLAEATNRRRSGDLGHTLTKCASGSPAVCGRRHVKHPE